jgi:hypothetical protein
MAITRSHVIRWGTVAVAAALTSALLTMPAAASPAPPLTFGIYPGGYAGGGSTDGKPDDPAKIRAALGALQGHQSQFLVRDYIDCATSFPDREFTDLGPGRRLDLVLTYNGESPAAWADCVRRKVLLYGPFAATISVTLEANISDDPNVIPALTNGVIAAKERANELGYHWLGIGFDEVAFGYVADTAFWRSLATTGGPEFARSVDYVGIDTYPDVPFPGVPSGPTDLTAFIGKALDTVRNTEMPIASLGASVPIRVSENGWATSATRTPAQQQQALTTEIDAINADRAEYHVLSYELFALRDDVTGSANIFDQFGIMTDDYVPKPMFSTYRDLIGALGGR